MCIEEIISSLYTLDGTDLTIDGDVLEVISLSDKSLKLKAISDTPGDYFIYEFKK
jgi:hypothetical protein